MIVAMLLLGSYVGNPFCQGESVVLFSKPSLSYQCRAQGERLSYSFDFDSGGETTLRWLTDLRLTFRGRVVQVGGPEGWTIKQDIDSKRGTTEIRWESPDKSKHQKSGARPFNIFVVVSGPDARLDCPRSFGYLLRGGGRGGGTEGCPTA